VKAAATAGLLAFYLAPVGGAAVNAEAKLGMKIAPKGIMLAGASALSIAN